MKKISAIFLFTCFMFSTLLGAGDHYEDEGKLYTVVICVAIILIGIVGFLFYLERRISKMEKENE